MRNFILVAGVSALVLANDVRARPTDDNLPNADDIIGSISFDLNQSGEVPQGDSFKVPAGTIKPGTRLGKPIDVSGATITYEFTGVPSWITRKDRTLTVSPTASTDDKAEISVHATAKKGPQVVAVGAVSFTIEPQRVYHVTVTKDGQNMKSTAHSYFTPCGSPDIRVNVIADKPVVPGPYKIELQGVPADITATINGAPSPITLDAPSGAFTAIQLQFTTKIASGAEGEVKVVITPPGASPSKLTFPTKYAAGHVESISPNLPMTARYLNKGSKVTLVGQGFCDDTSVAVGNVKATAKGDRGDSGKKLTFTLPDAATTGDLTITTKNGSFTKHIKVDNYRNVNGYAFDNSKEFHEKLGGYSVGDMDDLFGKDQTRFPLIELPLPETLVMMGLADAAAAQGMCFGMSLSSLKFGRDWSTWSYSGWDGKDADSETKSADDVWHLEGPPFTDGKNVSKKLSNKIHLQHAMQFELHVLDEMLEQYTGTTPDGFKKRVANALKNGDGALVSMIDWSEGSGHTVLAIDQRDTSDGGYEIIIYNPNIPFVNEGNVKYGNGQKDESAADGVAHASALGKSKIVVKKDGSFVLDQGSTYKGTVGDDLFIIPYSTFQKEPLMPSLFNLPDLIFGGAVGAKIEQVTDDAGKTLFRDGRPNTDAKTRIARGMAIMPLGGAGKADPMFLLDGNSSYTIKLANGAKPKYSAMAMGKGLAFHLADAPSKAGETDTVRFEPKSGAFEFSSSMPKSIAPRLVARHADNSIHDVTVRTNLGAKARGRFAFDDKRDVVTYSHAGGKASVNFDVGTSKRKNARLTTKSLDVEDGDVVTIKPDWDHVEDGKGEIRHKKRNGPETVHKMK